VMFREFVQGHFLTPRQSFNLSPCLLQPTIYYRRNVHGSIRSRLNHTDSVLEQLHLE